MHGEFIAVAQLLLCQPMKFSAHKTVYTLISMLYVDRQIDRQTNLKGDTLMVSAAPGDFIYTITCPAAVHLIMYAIDNSDIDTVIFVQHLE